ncbi:glycosyltransferase family 4 protein [Saccharopolyspora sp. CA-218241]|uniref:glycosyltransferase family 4 protein n=1 Tax=Saccharopolyspora sp. CA-218241 TaxID=3240027 RepID=UPI003D970A4E
MNRAAPGGTPPEHPASDDIAPGDASVGHPGPDRTPAGGPAPGDPALGDPALGDPALGGTASDGTASEGAPGYDAGTDDAASDRADTMTVVVDARWTRTDTHDGISRYGASLIEALHHLHPVTMLIHDERQLALLPSGVPHVKVNSPFSPRELWLSRTLNRLGADVVFSPLQIIGGFRRRYRLILTLHDLIYYRHPDPPGFLPAPVRLAWRLYHKAFWPQRVMLDRADAVVTVSETTRTLMAEHRLTRRPITVVPNAPSPPSTSDDDATSVAAPEADDLTAAAPTGIDAPAVADPTDADPTDVEPTDVEPTDAGPTGAELMDAGPSRTGPGTGPRAEGAGPTDAVAPSSGGGARSRTAGGDGSGATAVDRAPAERSDQAAAPGQRCDLVYMGSFMPYKNVETLIEGMAFLPGHRLHLVSRIVPRREAELRALLPAGADVVFWRGISEADYLELLGGAAALVTASRDEGFGLPIIEAMNAGTPVVCSDLAIFHEVTGGHAAFFDPGSAEGFAAAVREVVDPQVRDRLVESARGQAAEFTWASSAARLLELMRRLAG